MLLKFFLRKSAVWRALKQAAAGEEPSEHKPDEECLAEKLATNLAILRRKFESSPDMVIRQFQIGLRRDAALVFIDGLVKRDRVDETILRPLQNPMEKSETVPSLANIGAWIRSNTPNGEIRAEIGFDEIIDAILAGDTALFIDKASEAFAINTRDGTSRAIKEPEREGVLKGPREGFVEPLAANIALLRRKVRSPRLHLEMINLGQKSRTAVCIAYLKGVAGDGLIAEIKRRMDRINCDAILSSGRIEEFIADSPLSPFATIAYSERPDVVGAKILEGRAAVFIDGTPVVLTVPMFFMERFQTPDDYNFNFYYATLIRWIRFAAYALTVLSPALYVALMSYHPELIPTPLLITMAASVEGVPFPAVVEALAMGVTVEVLREAGHWMPGATGPVVTVLGLLVVGQALITAGLVGAPFVIVVAVTLVTSFVVPVQEDVNPLLRLFFVILSGFLGLYGLMLGFIMVYIHLATLRSFGVPYLAPLTPWNPHDAKDGLIRAPWRMLKRRPTLIGREDRIRQDNFPPDLTGGNEK